MVDRSGGALAGCSLRIAHGNGVKGSDERGIGGFDAIDNEIGVDVSVGEGPRGAVVTCDENLLHLIRTEVHGTTLRIDTAPGTSLLPTVDCVVEIAAPQLVALSTSGSGSVDAHGAWPELREVTTSGSGGAVVSGGPFVALEEVSVSGSGGILARDLTGTDAFVDLSGSGDSELTAKGLVTARLSGSGSLTLWGDPEVDAETSGSGDVHVE